ncbi:MAG: DUF1704 domain-containing protein, partial [Acidobacteria bacterium]|nr:DUF1704 domain-containing protein [Acidobacteriota bacterium]
MSFSPKTLETIRRQASILREAEKPVRVLRAIAWPEEVRRSFFAAGARELPRVTYQALDPGPALAAVGEARRLCCGDEVVDAWFGRIADAIESGARMLAAVGTREFYEHSRRLYPGPEDTLPDQATTSLGLARKLDSVIRGLAHIDVGAPAPACHLASAVAEKMRAAARETFGDEAPEVVIVEELSANALAGPRAIRLRRTACFSDRDIAQLIHHEALIHVATSLNGRWQEDLPILAGGHPGTTRTQEGLAVFAEMITGSSDLDRMGRLADRVLAIQMAIEGADFLEVYRFFLERGVGEEQAFENSRRVFRGGVLEGGAPFTKDNVYLGGLLRVHNFMRVAVTTGRSDCLRLLFCGKLDIE